MVLLFCSVLNRITVSNLIGKKQFGNILKKKIKRSVTVGIPYRKGFAGGGPAVLLLCKAQRKGL